MQTDEEMNDKSSPAPEKKSKKRKHDGATAEEKTEREERPLWASFVRVVESKHGQGLGMTSPISHLSPGSGSNRKLVAVPGPKAEEEELGFVGLFGLGGFSDKYTEGTKGTLYLPMGDQSTPRPTIKMASCL